MQAWKATAPSGNKAETERAAEKLRADAALHVRKPKVEGRQIPDGEVLELNLSHCQLQTIDLSPFTKLEKLSLAHNDITTLAGLNLERLTALKALDLRYNKLPMRSRAERAAVMKHLEGLSNMQLLGLSHNDDRVDRRPNQVRKTLFDGMPGGPGGKKNRPGSRGHSRAHSRSVSRDHAAHRRSLSRDSSGGGISPAAAAAVAGAAGDSPTPRHSRNISRDSRGSGSGDDSEAGILAFDEPDSRATVQETAAQRMELHLSPYVASTRNTCNVRAWLCAYVAGSLAGHVARGHSQGRVEVPTRLHRQLPPA